MTKKDGGVIGLAPKPIRKLINYERTFGQRSADFLTKWAGSWGFIILFFVFLILWMGANIYGWLNQWDPYPFILLNLVLSCLAAVQAPVILMSQNRQAQKDRIKAEYDYAVNRKSERQIEEILVLLKGGRKKKWRL
jgi:uncharacterized membrane protein